MDTFKILGYSGGELITEILTHRITDSLMLIAVLTNIYDELYVTIDVNGITETKHYAKDDSGKWNITVGGQA
jgi:hypothetical protein